MEKPRLSQNLHGGGNYTEGCYSNCLLQGEGAVVCAALSCDLRQQPAASPVESEAGLENTHQQRQRWSSRILGIIELFVGFCVELPNLICMDSF